MDGPMVPAPEELDEVVAFIAAQQVQPGRNVAYVGSEPAGLAAELGGLEPPWATTARVERDGTGAISGTVVVEWDTELGRSWVLGPWVAGEGAAWTAAAERLLDAALAQSPAGVTRHEMSGDIANLRLAGLAASRGWHATEPNHILVADAAVVATWPEPATAGGPHLRPATPDDLGAIAPLHDAEFPGTFASAAQLVDGQADGSRVVLVATGGGGGGRVTGYAAGQVHEDGEGFVDFIAVDPEARGSGAGRRLVVALTRELLGRSSLGRVALTVQDHRTPARGLYQHLGFRPEGTLVAYRSWAPEG